MLHPFKDNLTLPKYSELSEYDGKGNWAIAKYYKWPHRYFYRHKLKMIVKMMGNERFGNILDYGSGPGIFTKELKKHTDSVTSYDIHDSYNTRWKFDLVICASVLEFVEMHYTLQNIRNVTKVGGSVIVASPMDTWITRKYFNSIHDQKKRNSHQKIMYSLKKYFKIKSYEEWMGMYFCTRVVR